MGRFSELGVTESRCGLTGIASGAIFAAKVSRGLASGWGKASV